MVKIGAIILAAGASKRMGAPKLFLPIHQKPLFMHCLEVALANTLTPVLLIAGAHAEDFRKRTKELDVQVLYNAQYTEGMSTSLKLGMEAMGREIEATMIFLADQPFVPSIVIQSLMEQYRLGRERGILIVRPSYDGVPGHPIIVDAQLFPKFHSLKGDTGGKEIIKEHQHLMVVIPFPNTIWGADIDTQEDYVNMKNHSQHDTR